MPRSINVRFSGPEPIEGAEHLQLLGVRYVPVEYPQLVVSWEDVIEGGQIQFPSGMRIEPWPALPVNERLHIAASFVRDLPTTKLERAARMAAELHLGMGVWDRKKLLDAYWPEGAPPDIPEVARAMVRERW